MAASNTSGVTEIATCCTPPRPFRHRLEAEAREVEEGEHVAVADVEEEVRRALVVTVLEQLDEREPEQVLVEADRALGVGADQREMVHAAAGRGRPLGLRAQVPLAQGLRGELESVQVGTSRRPRPRNQPFRNDRARLHRMKVGVSLRSGYAPMDARTGARWLVERARAARDAGLDSLFIGDHHNVPVPYYQNVPMLGRLLAEWDDRPAGALFLLPLWHPVLLAEQIGTLASIAAGPVRHAVRARRRRRAVRRARRADAHAPVAVRGRARHRAPAVRG